MDGSATTFANGFATLRRGREPVLAIAAHHGHDIRADAKSWVLLGEDARFREEDPWTGTWTSIGDSAIVVQRSRFEVDVNRPRDLAVYRTAEAAWGLTVWHPDTPAHVFQVSLDIYDEFYRTLRAVLDELTAEHGRVLVLDLHSYNHCRGGPAALPDDPQANPEINLGTGTMDRERWAPLVDRFIDDLQAFSFLGRRLDVRENVRFRGGHLSLWIHTEYPESVCVLAVEVKKFFMDEWTNLLDEGAHRAIAAAFAATLPGQRQELQRAGRSHSG